MSLSAPQRKIAARIAQAALLVATSGVFAASLPNGSLASPKPAQVSAAKAPATWRDAVGLYAQAKETCFLKGEKTEGMNKICFYDCTSGGAAITVSAVSLCPLSIQK